MGVSGCGKSTMGELISARLDLPYHEGDSYHPASNIAKMAGGMPLCDEDRWGWLTTCGKVLSTPGCVVLACSALKKNYRDFLRSSVLQKSEECGESARNLIFIYLKGSFDLINARMISREGHYMKSDMLQSQFDALEEPEGDELQSAIVVELEGKSAEELLETILEDERVGRP